MATADSASWLLTFSEQVEFRPLSPSGEIKLVPRPVSMVPLVTAAGGALLAWTQESSHQIHIAPALPGAAYIESSPLEVTDIPSETLLSAESEHGTLLTFEETQAINGAPHERIFSSVITVTPKDGGVTDASFDADSPDSPSTPDSGQNPDASLDAEGGIDAGTDSGFDARAEGGIDRGRDGAADASTPDHGPSSDGDGCDCRIGAPRSANDGTAALLIALSIVFVTARRSPRRGARPSEPGRRRWLAVLREGD